VLPGKQKFAVVLSTFHHLLFSAYLSLLVIWTNAKVAKFPWIWKVARLITPSRIPHSFMDPDVLHATALLWGLLAVLILLAVRILWQLSNRSTFQLFVGLIDTLGFPLACICFVGFRFSFIEVVGAAICVVAYSRHRSRLSKSWSVALFAAHFALWIAAARTTSANASGLTVLWPGYDLGFRQYPDLIYPILGLLSSLCWVKEVRDESLANFSVT
jgi:hypothetical protein